MSSIQLILSILVILVGAEASIISSDVGTDYNNLANNNIGRANEPDNIGGGGGIGEILIPKFKKGMNLGRKMCQIDQRNCRSFSESKRFNQEPRDAFKMLLNYLKTRENMAPGSSYSYEARK